MTSSNTSSNLGHTVGKVEKSNNVGATGYQTSEAGNVTSAAGASNPATGGGQKRPDGPSQEIAGTLSNDFTLANTKAESKESDKVVPNNPEGEALDSSAAGPGGDTKRMPLQSHDLDIPVVNTDGRTKQPEQTGEATYNHTAKR